MMFTHQYKTTKVEAYDTTQLEGGLTQAIPQWVIDGVVAEKSIVNIGKKWIVKKPNGSIGFYTQQEFDAEFEALPEVAS